MIDVLVFLVLAWALLMPLWYTLRSPLRRHPKPPSITKPLLVLLFVAATLPGCSPAAKAWAIDFSTTLAALAGQCALSDATTLVQSVHTGSPGWGADLAQIGECVAPALLAHVLTHASPPSDAELHRIGLTLRAVAVAQHVR